MVFVTLETPHTTSTLRGTVYSHRDGPSRPGKQGYMDQQLVLLDYVKSKTFSRNFYDVLKPVYATSGARFCFATPPKRMAS